MSKSPKHQWKLVTDLELITRAKIALGRIKEGDIDDAIFMFPLSDCVKELEERLKTATEKVVLDVLDGTVVSSKRIDGINKANLAEYEHERGRRLVGPAYPAERYASHGLTSDAEKFVLFELKKLGLKIDNNCIRIKDFGRASIFTEKATLEAAGYEISPHGVRANLPTLARK